MQFLEAKRIVKKMAQGDYHSVTFELVEFCGERDALKTTCTVYINKYQHHSGSTWQEAINKLNLEISMVPLANEELEQGV